MLLKDASSFDSLEAELWSTCLMGQPKDEGLAVPNELLKNYSERDFLAKYDLLGANKRILNAGSSSVRYGSNCVNVDVQQKQGVDIVCDIHDLPDSLGTFDAVVCNAVLQYCHNPKRVAEQFHRILRPDGLLFVDVPWIQPYCPDTPDLFRFSEDGLREIFADFELIEIGTSIRPGSAFAMLGVRIAQTLTRNKYVNYACALLTATVLLPFCAIRTTQENRSAGGIYLIGRKSDNSGPFV